VLGLIVGVAGVLAWHYATPTIDTAVDPYGEYDGEYVSLSNATVVYPGVSWWPVSVLIFATMAVAIVAAGGVISVVSARNAARTQTLRVGGNFVRFAALGTAAGLALAAVGSVFPRIRPSPTYGSEHLRAM
jgi:hypothetical protein